MVEIDYYSKYLKYKQKYLKQKNLQIGGEMITINIYIDEYIIPYEFDPQTKDNKKKPRRKYKDQNFDNKNQIKSSISDWLKTNRITSKIDFVVQYTSQKIYYDSQRTFEQEKIESGDEIIVFLGSK
jgi:hypothetical protein